MNFFQSQEHARRQTTKLVVYYALAVVLIIVGVYMAIALTFIGVASQTEGLTVETPRLWNGELALGVAIGTLLIVLMGTVFKVIQLGKGGAAVAESLGAREVDPSTTNRDERKLRNIVEEMSIASGVPMPRIFVMDNEDGINAFAAGFSIDQAVVAVTRGCIQQLTRDELQGVIAHEFSHILNGDMRLNIRLMGVLNGILIIGMLGYYVMRMTMFGGRSSRSDKKGGALPIAIMGLIIMAVGYIGVLFGKLIKAAVSRQREFLADASAVQFTRNPDGIANALKKIGGFDDGSRVQHAKAEQASHFFFANGIRQSFVGLFATHPPLEERIRRIDPAFDGELKARAQDTVQTTSAHEGLSGFAGASAAPERIAVSAEQVVARIGTPTPEHVAYAQQLLHELPAPLVDAAHEGFGARAVVYALLLDSRDAIESTQMSALKVSADADVYAEVERLREAAKAIRPEYRLPLIDITLPALRTLSHAQFDQFKANVDTLVRADEQIDLFEYALQHIILRHLEPRFTPKPPAIVRHKNLLPALPSCQALLSCLAGWGAKTEAAALNAYESGWRELLVPDSKLALIPASDCGLQMLDTALDDLEHAAPPVKQRIVAACVSCIGADGDVTVEEGELIRAICDALHCPMPPFLRDAA